MKKNKAFYFALGLFAFAMAACHTHEDSPTIKEAVEVHKNMRTLYQDLESIAEAKKQEYMEAMDQAKQNADTASAEQLVKFNEQLESIHHDLASWKENLVEVPGHCFHAEGEPHEHHDQPHLKDLSEEEILELQKELENQLKQLEGKLKGLKTE